MRVSNCINLNACRLGLITFFENKHQDENYQWVLNKESKKQKHQATIKPSATTNGTHAPHALAHANADKQQGATREQPRARTHNRKRNRP